MQCYHGDAAYKVDMKDLLMIEEENVEQGIEAPQTDAQAVTDDDVQQPIYNKIQLQDVVNREKRKAFERGKKEALMQLQQEQQQQMQDNAPQQQQAPMQQQQAPSLGGMQQMSAADVERMIAEKAPQALQEQMNRLKQEHSINTFVQKMQVAEQKYPGLEAKLNKLDYEDPSLMRVVDMANSMENTGDIMNEILNNTGKMATFLNLSRQPQIAQQAMMELSSSIKTNQDALAAEKQARDPMNQLKPSSSVGSDNANPSMHDLRKMFSR
jgi:hypothetical protein